MFSKLNTKVLIGVFAVLLLIALFAMLRNNSQSAVSRNRTFESELTDFDSTAVSKIILYPKNYAVSIELSKTDKKWFVKNEGSEYNADPGAIKSMLGSLIEMRATRIAANDKSQWEKYEVTDSLATRVQVYSGKKVVADVYIGKFSYQQPKNQNPYMQQQGKMTSYVRMENGKEVYAVNGFLAMTFNRQPNDFRNRSLINSSKDQWTRLSFTGPQEIFNLTKQGTSWMIDGLETDSTTTAKFLNSLNRLNSSDFIEPSTLVSDNPVYTLTIEGENIPAPIKIYAHEADTSNKFAISSSLNQGTYFSGGKSDLFDKVFPVKESFFENKQE